MPQPCPRRSAPGLWLVILLLVGWAPAKLGGGAWALNQSDALSACASLCTATGAGLTIATAGLSQVITISLLPSPPPH